MNNIGELYIALGIKGADKTVGALKDVKKGLGETAAMSLEAKAAIVGAVYALEQFFAKSGAAGTNLTNFNAITGQSVQEFQKWQYAARQAGVSNEDFAGSFKNVQNAMTNVLLGKNGPEGIGLVASKVGLDPAKLRDTYYVLGQLQKFATQVPADISRSVLSGFGVSEGTQAALKRGTFNAKNFAAAPTYSDREIRQLDKANIAWSNLTNKIEMAIGHFNALHGGQLVSDISKIVDQVVRLATEITKLSDKLKFFQAIGGALGGVATALKDVNDIIDPKTRSKGIQSTGKDTLDVLGHGTLMGPFIRALGQSIQQNNQYWQKQYPTPSNSPGMIAPPMPGRGGKSVTQNVNVNQNLNFQHEGKDSQKTSQSVKKAVQDAFRQFSIGEAS